MTQPPARSGRRPRRRPQRSEDLGQVVIGPREIYDRLGDVQSDVTEVKAQVRELAQSRGQDAAAIAELRPRVAALERRVYIASGFAAALGGVLGRIFDAF